MFLLCKDRILTLVVLNLYDVGLHSFETLYKSTHNFVNTVNPLCPSYLKTESTEHYFLYFHNYVTFCTTLMNKLNKMRRLLVPLKSDEFVRRFFHWDKKFDNEFDSMILTVTIKFIKNVERSEQALSWAAVFMFKLIWQIFFSLAAYKEKSCKELFPDRHI